MYDGGLYCLLNRVIFLQFRREEDAEKAVSDLNNRWFAGRPVYAELSPVTDFREACCRQYELGWVFGLPVGKQIPGFYLFFLNFVFFLSIIVYKNIPLND